jgi:transposase
MVEFWYQADAAEGKAFFEQWYRSVMPIKLPAVKKAAKSLMAHLGGLLTYFKHHIIPQSRALTKEFNSKIQALKPNARDFHSLENYRTGIIFFCAKLDMMPAIHSPATHPKT